VPSLSRSAGALTPPTFSDVDEAMTRLAAVDPSSAERPVSPVCRVDDREVAEAMAVSTPGVSRVGFCASWLATALIRAR
jgi:hypothetical protein